MTDKKAPLATEPTIKTDNQEPVTKATEKKVSTKETTANNSQNKVSKLALIAIVIALSATAGHYFWQQQQSQLLAIKLTEQMKQALIEQKKVFSEQLQQVAVQIDDNSQAKITELNTTVSQLERSIQQRQPSDWLLHEAEYLIRIAARTLWLEHDTTAAIGLLKDADARLAELNNPTFLPVRELVHLDIKSLELMPTLQTDEVVLTLMAMNKQVSILPLAIVGLGAETDKNTNLELSNNLNDWQTNLAKTWQKFLDDFIRVRQRTGLIQPLMSPEQQQHLKQNLSLKIQLSLWAASERKSDIYQQTLTDIQQWLTEFFDLEEATTQHFLKTLTNLQTQRVSYNYPSELTSLTAIRTALINKPTKPQISPNKTADEVGEKPQDKQSEELKTEPKNSSSLPKQQNEQPSDEGSI